MGNRTVTNKSGWGQSSPETFTILNGTSGSLLDPVDLGRSFWAILIRCADASRIPAATTLGLHVCYDADEYANTPANLKTLQKPDLQGVWVSANLPTSGDFAAVILGAIGARYVRPVLSQNANGGSVVLEIIGIDPGMGDGQE